MEEQSSPLGRCYFEPFAQFCLKSCPLWKEKQESRSSLESQTANLQRPTFRFLNHWAFTVLKRWRLSPQVTLLVVTDFRGRFLAMKLLQESCDHHSLRIADGNLWLAFGPSTELRAEVKTEAASRLLCYIRSRCKKEAPWEYLHFRVEPFKRHPAIEQVFTECKTSLFYDEAPVEKQRRALG